MCLVFHRQGKRLHVLWGESQDLPPAVLEVLPLLDQAARPGSAPSTLSQ
jgi:hypothetical protein